MIEMIMLLVAWMAVIGFFTAWRAKAGELHAVRLHADRLAMNLERAQKKLDAWKLDAGMWEEKAAEWRRRTQIAVNMLNGEEGE